MSSEDKLMPCGSYDAPVATIRYANVGDLKNEMPQVMSCIDLPDGNYEVYLRPAREEVSGEREIVAIDVIQLDRDAAADVLFHVDGDPFVSNIRDGIEDDSYLVKRFAEHRIAAMTPKPAEAASGVGDPCAWPPEPEMTETLRHLIGDAKFVSITPATEKAVAWTGSGSIIALQDGRQGFIWPESAAAHPIPLFFHPPAADVAGLREAEGHIKALMGVADVFFQKAKDGSADETWSRDIIKAAKQYLDRNKRQAPYALPEEPSA